MALRRPTGDRARPRGGGLLRLRAPSGADRLSARGGQAPGGADRLSSGAEQSSGGADRLSSGSEPTPRPPSRNRPGAGTASAVPAASDDAAVAHLRGADPVIGALVERIGPLSLEDRRRGRPDDAYGSLLRAIVGQQLSTKAARSIYERLLELFGGRTPEPAELLAADPETVRAVGLSRAKVAYLRDLAAHVEDDRLPIHRLGEQDDAAVAAELTAVKGLGQWTADMFLIFHLGRPDILAVGDLGIRRAVERAYGLDALPPAAELERIAEPWRPQRTLACLYLWRSLDNEP